MLIVGACWLKFSRLCAMCQSASHADMHVTASAKYVAQSTTGMIKSEKEGGRPVTMNMQGSARHMNMTSASG